MGENERLYYLLANSDISEKYKKEISRDYTIRNTQYYLGNIKLYKDNYEYIKNTLIRIKEINEKMTDSLSSSYGVKPKNKNVKESDNIAISIDRKRQLESKLEIIEKALMKIPKPYREGLINHIVYDEEYKSKYFDYVDIEIWKRWQRKLIYEVALLRGQREIISILKK